MTALTCSRFPVAAVTRREMPLSGNRQPATGNIAKAEE
jgi:hypothetical protein